HLQNEIKSIEENASLAEKALVKMLAPLAENMLRSGKSLDDVRQKFKLLGIDAVTANNIIATLPKSFSDAANG
ncbi:hypothetical protein, partial [Acinetobacter nosocomialis]